MKRSIKMLAILSLLLLVAGSMFAEITRPEKETSEMKTLRHRGTQLRIAKIKLAVKYGYLTQAKANYIIKRINFMKRFKDNNPEWVKYSRRFRKFRKMHRRFKHRGYKRGMRRGMRGKMGRKYGPRFRKGKFSKWCEWRKNLKSEPAAMRTIRHKKAEVKILRIRFAAKNGFITQQKATYKIKKIKAIQRFKDNNPEWVQFKRSFRKRGRRHGCRYGKRGYRRGMRRGHRRHHGQ